MIRITPDDVGQRVSLRYWLDDAAEGDGGPRHSDVVGTLEAWADGWLEVRRRDGAVTRVDEAALVAGKTIPPNPHKKS